jgi:CubicO group peptidase (beta-lactamase class C family)
MQQPIADFFPQAETHGLTLERLLTLTSGWPYREFRSAPKTVAEMLAAPLSWRPGERFSYGETPPHLMSAILTQVTGCSTASFARRELFEPLGIWRDAEQWRDRPGTHNLGPEPTDGLPWRCDADGITAGGYGLHLTLRDMARFGLLYASQGIWAGQQLIPADWVRTSGTPHSPGGSPMWMPYGYFWWLPMWHRGGARLAAGYGGQEIYVNPELDLVVAIACTLRDDQPPDNRKITTQYLLPAIRDWQ